jgi:F0F1-type ATP synthase assembly protein I
MKERKMNEQDKDQHITTPMLFVAAALFYFAGSDDGTVATVCGIAASALTIVAAVLIYRRHRKAPHG